MFNLPRDFPVGPKRTLSLSVSELEMRTPDRFNYEPNPARLVQTCCTIETI